MRKEHHDILMTLIEMEKRGQLDRASFEEVPIQVYHHPACPGISSTTLKTVLTRSWNHHVHGVRAETDAFRFGNAFHTFTNEPKLFNETYLVSPLESRRGNDYKELQAKAEIEEKIIISMQEFKSLTAMKAKVDQHPQARALVHGSKCEVTFFSRDARTGLLKKCRVDNLKGKVLSDLKSCMNAGETEFMYQSRKYLYRISGAYYLEIVGEVFGEMLNDFYLIACEKVQPFDVNVFPIHPDSLAVADEEIRTALDRIVQATKDPSAWKGYALDLKPLLI